MATMADEEDTDDEEAVPSPRTRATSFALGSLVVAALLFISGFMRGGEQGIVRRIHSRSAAG